MPCGVIPQRTQTSTHQRRSTGHDSSSRGAPTRTVASKQIVDPHWAHTSAAPTRPHHRAAAASPRTQQGQLHLRVLGRAQLLLPGDIPWQQPLARLLSRHRSCSPHPKQRRHGRSGSGSSSSSSSGGSSSSSSESRHRRRHHHCCRSSSLEDFWAPPFPSCMSTPAKYLVRRIQRGKFVNFDKLLGPALGEGSSAILGQEKREKDKGAGRRRVVDLATWLEAWNIFLAIRIQTVPDSALTIVKYQAVITMQFGSYPAGVCLKYDSGQCAIT